MFNLSKSFFIFVLELVFVTLCLIGLTLFGQSINSTWICISLGLLTYVLWHCYFLYYFVINLPNLHQQKDIVLPPAIGIWAEIYKQLYLNMNFCSLSTKVRKEFIANVSHELRTPITVISGYLESLEVHLQKDKTLLFSIKNMQQQSTRMNTIVEDLLTLASLENNDLQRKSFKIIYVPLLLESLISDAQVLNKKKQHKFIVSIDNNLNLIGNETQIRSVFSNLISNAIKYTPANGKIEISWKSQEINKNNPYGIISPQSIEEQSVFLVKDNGIGIEEKHIQRITERFYRVDKARSQQTGGSGLGLSIVKHILTHHNAELEIDSQFGKGSQFSCLFN